MIVRCVNILSPLGDELTEHDAIAVGGEYVVLALVASPGHEVFLRVIAREPTERDLHHPGPPALWRSQMFQITSDTIPSNWRISIGPTGTTELAPAAWLRPAFWTDLIDWSPTSEASQEDYRRELAIILDEAKQQA